MKINIGPYPSGFRFHRWKCRYLELMYGDSWYDIDEQQYIWLDHLVAFVCEKLDKYITDPLHAITRRKVKIKYHDYDTWNLDHTLALVILPGLKQLKASRHGYSSVENEDLPTACLKDASREERWEWVMDEMIWAFNEIANDYPGADAFSTGNIDLRFKKLDNGLSKLDKGPNHTFNVDFDGRKKYDDRIQRGLNLFAKYYRSLWD